MRHPTADERPHLRDDDVAFMLYNLHDRSSRTDAFCPMLREANIRPPCFGNAAGANCSLQLCLPPSLRHSHNASSRRLLPMQPPAGMWLGGVGPSALPHSAGPTKATVAAYCSHECCQIAFCSPPTHMSEAERHHPCSHENCICGLA
jgi:hypothetical protein